MGKNTSKEKEIEKKILSKLKLPASPSLIDEKEIEKIFFVRNNGEEKVAIQKYKGKCVITKSRIFLPFF